MSESVLLTREERDRLKIKATKGSFMDVPQSAEDMLRALESDEEREKREIEEHKAYLFARNEIFRLRSMLLTASYPDHYISTACQRGLHEHCRITEKWSGEQCQCPCGHTTSAPKPTYQELESLVKSLVEALRTAR